MKKRGSWKANVDLLLDILHDQARRELALVVDCDATGEKLEQARISRFGNGANATAKDLLEQRKHLADKSIMRYDEHFLDATITNAPAARRPVKIPCPGPECGPHHLYDWICFKCHVSIEYGHVDRFLYCDCGRTPYDRYAFKCQNPEYGSTFGRYKSNKLLRILEDLPTPREPADSFNSRSRSGMTRMRLMG